MVGLHGRLPPQAGVLLRLGLPPLPVARGGEGMLTFQEGFHKGLSVEGLEVVGAFPHADEPDGHP